MSPRETGPTPEELKNPEEEAIKGVSERIHRSQKWPPRYGAKHQDLEHVLKIRDLSAEKVSSPEKAAEIIALADKIALRHESAEDTRAEITDMLREIDFDSEKAKAKFPELEEWSDEDIEVFLHQLGKYGSWELV